MKVSELGEFGLIKVLADIINESGNLKNVTADRLIQGIGDDTSVWNTKGLLQLATTDSLIQDTHFTLQDADWELLGHKAIAVNLSDIAAMGGIPDYALISLVLPGHIEVSCISSLYQGMVNISNQSGLNIAGGNIASSNIIVISITIIGHLKDKTFLSRSASVPGDKIAVTGYTGLSAAGLIMLKQKMDFDAESRKLLYEAHLKPIPRLHEGEILLQHGVKAAIDISDGLIADITHICEASKVSAAIRQDLLPVHPILTTYFADNYYGLILCGGEDYELVFTASEHIIKGIRKELSCPVTIIGDIIEGKPGEVDIIDNSGNVLSWQQQGWEHFKS